MSKREVEDGELSDENEPEAKRTKYSEFADFVIDSGGIRTVEEDEGDNRKDDGDEVVKSGWKDNIEKLLLGEKAIDEPKKRRFPRNTCFNCGGDHMIVSCPEPRDQNRIRKAQLELRLQQQNSNSSKRYLDTGDNSDAKFKPGRLSAKLREALKIGPDDIPEWIYRMRRMGFYKGYPPGYLKRAIKIDKSRDLLRFHTTSTNIAQVQPDAAEIRPAPIVENSKIVYYMGFNNKYRALNDLERFNIPPFEKFCEFLQAEVDEKHQKDEVVRIQQLEMNRLMNPEKKNEDIDELIVIDRNGKEEEAQPEEEEKVENQEEEQGEEQDLDKTTEDVGCLGDSISLHIGTPIPARRATDGSLIRQHLPDLKNFTVGIVPFEPKEENVGEKGIFKRIMSKIKDFATGETS